MEGRVATQHAHAAGTAVDDLALREWLAIDGTRMHGFVRALTTWIWDHLFRLRTYGQANIPAEGGFVFCANHASYVDPFLQARGQPRVVRFMAKAEVFGWPIAGRLVRSGGGFPVRRGKGDAFAMQLARHIVDDGQPVALYPEGTRFRSGPELGPPKSGAARLVLEAGVPVVPVATFGSKPRRARGDHSRLPRRPKVTTLYGAPMSFAGVEPTAENVAAVRDEIWAEVERLYALAGELTARRRRPATYEVPARPPRDGSLAQ